MPDKLPISVVMIARNEAGRIATALASVSRFDDVLVYENGSTDNTAEVIARHPHARLVQGEFVGYGPTRNVAAEHARHDWIFALDCDERCTPALLDEIATLPLDDPECVYAMPRHNWLFGRRVRFGDWGNDEVVRLYHRRHSAYSNSPVHESVEVRGRCLRLRGAIEHDTAATPDDLLPKINRYTGIQAGKRPRRKAAALIYLRARWAFWRSYVLQLGFLDGWRGVLTAWYIADNTFYKHMKANVLARRAQDADSA